MTSAARQSSITLYRRCDLIYSLIWLFLVFSRFFFIDSEGNVFFLSIALLGGVLACQISILFRHKLSFSEIRQNQGWIGFSLVEVAISLLIASNLLMRAEKLILSESSRISVLICVATFVFTKLFCLYLVLRDEVLFGKHRD